MLSEAEFVMIMFALFWVLGINFVGKHCFEVLVGVCTQVQLMSVALVSDIPRQLFDKFVRW